MHTDAKMFYIVYIEITNQNFHVHVQINSNCVCEKLNKIVQIRSLCYSLYY